MEERVQDNFTNRSDESMETVKHPQQEIGGQKIASDTELLRGVLENPEVLALFHQKFKELEKPEGQLKWKKPLHVVVGFVQGWGVPARMSLSWMKAILFFFWTRLLQVFNMFSEIRKEKVTELSEVQRNLKAVNETHEKVQENAEDVEDQVHPCFLKVILNSLLLVKVTFGGFHRKAGVGQWSERSSCINLAFARSHSGLDSMFMVLVVVRRVFLRVPGISPSELKPAHRILI